MRLFTADTHFNHRLLARMRGYSDTIPHDEVLVSIWNSYVGKRDEVYHVGDFCFGSHKAVRQVRHRLNGKIHLILGNHDRANRLHNLRDTFTSIHDLLDIKINGHPVTLCHYAMRIWNKSHYNSWQLFGHSHGGTTPVGKQHDVGVDNNRMTLLTEEDIVKIMDRSPNNLNYLSHHAEGGEG
jgi:calcineurin-like phosphoesterase family protein